MGPTTSATASATASSTTRDDHRSADVVVIGGGVIGLACAWRAANRGLRALVVDPAPGNGASWAAAGMLAPVTEAHYGEEALIRLNLASARAWPGFAAELGEAASAEVGYQACGTLAVAHDSGDMAALKALYAFQRSLGLPSEMVGRSRARELEPLLSPAIRGGLLAAGDHQVHTRALVQALLVATRRSGVDLLAGPVAAVTTSHDRVTGVRFADGTQLAAGQVLLAAGCWSGHIAGVPPEAVPPVRPVKGVILRLRAQAPRPSAEPPRPILSRNLRGLVRGSSIYLVPRADGTVVVGATVEEQGFDTTVRAGSVADLLRDARCLLPAVDELALVEAHAGLRPGSPDNAPLLGQTGMDGLVIATGHFRNGILLAPVTADAIAQLLDEGTTPELIAPFSPQRWQPAGATVR
ncbi:MAG: glycine oxidase ThiO [Acidimicrobiales bacterium]